jgi:hypothetical protein
LESDACRDIAYWANPLAAPALAGKLEPQHHWLTKESVTVLHKFAEASDRIQSSINASSIASNGATIEVQNRSGDGCCPSVYAGRPNYRTNM